MDTLHGFLATMLSQKAPDFLDIFLNFTFFAKQGLSFDQKKCRMLLDLLRSYSTPIEKNSSLSEIVKQIQTEKERAIKWVAAPPAIIHDEYSKKLFARQLLEPDQEKDALSILPPPILAQLREDPIIKDVHEKWQFDKNRQFKI
jgi:HSP90 family molecular chaperone